MTIGRQKHIPAVKSLIDSRQYRTALDVIRSLDRRNASASSSFDDILLSLDEAECLLFLNSARDALEITASIEALFRSGHQHSIYARTCLLRGIAQSYIGRCAEAIESLQISRFAYKRLGDVDGESRALNWLGHVYFETGDFSMSRRAYSECAETAGKANLQRWQVISVFNMSKPLITMGQLATAASAMESVEDSIPTLEEPLNEIRYLLLRSYLELQLRRYDLARVRLSHMQARLVDSTHTREQGAWCEYMGELELCCGNHLEAELHLQRAIEIGSGESRDESVIGQSRRLLAEVRLAQSDLDETMAECERALISIRQVGERFEEGVVYRIMGEVESRRGSNAESRAAFKQSLDILRDIGAKLELAKTCLVAGESLVFSRRERLANLAEAERLFEDVGVQYWIDRTRDELKRVLNDRGDEMAEEAKAHPGAKGPYFITADDDTIQTLELANRYARKDIAILITGETGTGKDQLARHIHAISHRHDKPLVAIDLNNIPESLWESELFGHRKGTFTGANAEKTGLLESANGGTVFLNEIGNLPLGLQAKLLEFLDTHQVRRLGELKSIDLDVRLIAATNLDLKKAVDKGTFRSDLYYRLAQAPLQLKPLRERRCDILPLIRHFLVEYGVPAGELSLLDRQVWVDRACNGQWSGNARDLRSFVYRLVALADRPADPEFPRWAALLVEQVDVIHEPGPTTLPTKESLLTALENCGWNQRAAARDLKISESTVRRLISRFEIGRSSAEEQADVARD